MAEVVLSALVKSIHRHGDVCELKKTDLKDWGLEVPSEAYCDWLLNGGLKQVREFDDAVWIRARST